VAARRKEAVRRESSSNWCLNRLKSLPLGFAHPPVDRTLKRKPLQISQQEVPAANRVDSMCLDQSPESLQIFTTTNTSKMLMSNCYVENDAEFEWYESGRVRNM
jgi:hypothetical protein